MARKAVAPVSLHDREATLFCRVSSSKQAANFSTDSQERLGREYAARLGLTITRVFRVVESASKAQSRQQWAAYLDYVRRGPERHALIAKVDRAMRNFQDQAEVSALRERHGKVVHFFIDQIVLDAENKSPSVLQYGILGSFAAYYAAELAEKSKRGTDQKALSGEFPNRAPFGYLNDVKTKRLVVDKEHAHWVKRIKTLSAEGVHSLDAITERLREEGCRVKGRPLYRNMVERVIRNPLYSGRFDWPTGSGNWIQGTHPAIVSWELHEAAVAGLERKNRPRYRKHLFVMAGMIRCGCCPEGRAVVFELRKNKFTYAHCTGYRRSKAKQPDGSRPRMCPDAVFVPTATLDEQVEQLLGLLEISDEMAQFIADRLLRDGAAAQSAAETQAAILKGQLSKVRSRIDAAYADKLDGKIDEAFWADQNRKLSAERVRLEEALRARSGAGPSAYMPNVRQVLKLAKAITSTYKTGDVSEKRRLLNAVCSNWRLVGKKLEYTMRTPFAELAEGRLTGDWLRVCGVIQTWAAAQPDLVIA